MLMKPKSQKIKKIALIAPSGIVSQTKLKKSKENIKRLGKEPVVFPNAMNRYGYLAGKDDERLNDIQQAFEDKSIDAIFCIRGGYGATRILDKIDYEIIKKNPKIFVGFSDITAYQSAFFVKAGLVSFHGIIGASNFTDYIIQQLQDLIFCPVENYILPHTSFDVLTQGKAKGRIVGGNLSLLVSMIGTEYIFPFTDKLVFIEEIAEPPYKIDRMLNHLLMATDIKKAAGIVFGSFRGCTPEENDTLPENSLRVEEIIEEKFAGLNIPIVYNLNFGHIENSLIFPIGVKARLDTQNKKIQLLEKATI